MKYLILALVFISCKKNTIEPNVNEPIKTLTYSGFGITYTQVKLNGKVTSFPLQVKNKDIVDVIFYGQATTPQQYNMGVFINIDGVYLDGCNPCYEFKKQIIIN